MGTVDLGLTHIALPVADLDRSIEFYKRFADMAVVHRRVAHDGDTVAWLSDLTRPFVVVLLQSASPASRATLGGWAHLGIGCVSRHEVDRRMIDAAELGHSTSGPHDDGPPVGYWGIIVDPDGHNLELAFGQEVTFTVEHAQHS
jgi:catechol 2,3-dioxygenase-like lactoylglutathione lyase family enzyme